MAQTIIPAPYGDMTIGWWRQSKPIARLRAIPSAVATNCGHTLAGEDAGGGFVIPAANRTHCTQCDESGAGRVPDDPLPGIPTVVSTVCRHPLSGWATPIGPTTVSAVASSPICPDCKDFGEIVGRMAERYRIWEINADFDRSAVAASRTTKEWDDYDWMKKAVRYICNQYQAERFVYENKVIQFQKYQPDLPPVSARGVTLLPPVGSEYEVAVPDRRDPTPTTPTRRVTFAEDQEYPSRDTARMSTGFKRTGPGYQPGRYADTTGQGHLNTSRVTLYRDPPGSPATPSTSNSPMANSPRSAMRGGRRASESTSVATEEQQDTQTQSPFTLQYVTARAAQSGGQSSQSWTMPESEK